MTFFQCSENLQLYENTRSTQVVVRFFPQILTNVNLIAPNVFQIFSSEK